VGVGREREESGDDKAEGSSGSLARSAGSGLVPDEMTLFPSNFSDVCESRRRIFSTNDSALVCLDVRKQCDRFRFCWWDSIAKW
jgi:hypothetical protein